MLLVTIIVLNCGHLPLNNMKFSSKQSGFTLIELLLYLAISSLILLTAIMFLWTLLEARVKNQTIAEVEAQGRQVIEQITQTVRNAEAITSPGVGSSGGTLTLDVVDSGDDPTVFTTTGGVVTISEGGGSAVSLTNDLVSVSGLAFENLSRTDTPGALKISFTISYQSDSNLNQYDYTKTFYGTASLR